MEMAYHALEILHSIVASGESSMFKYISSTFDLPDVLPSGFLGESYLGASEESCLAFSMSSNK